MGAEATIAKMEKKKKDMTAQFESQKAKVDAMPEVKEMLKMQEQMKSAVKEYDSSVPRMKAQLPKMKEVRDKKAKKVGARRPSFSAIELARVASPASHTRHPHRTSSSPRTRPGARRKKETRRRKSKLPRTKKQRTR